MKINAVVITLLGAIGVCEASFYTTTVCSVATLPRSTTTITVYPANPTSTMTMASLSSDITADGISGSASSSESVSTTLTSTTTMTNSVFSYVDTTTMMSTDMVLPTSSTEWSSLLSPTSGSSSDMANAAQTAANGSMSTFANTTPSAIVAPSSSLSNPHVCVSALDGIVFDCGTSTHAAATISIPPFTNTTSTSHTTVHVRSTITSTETVYPASASASLSAFTAGAATGTGAAGATGSGTNNNNPLNGGYSGAIASFIGAGEHGFSISLSIACIAMTGLGFTLLL